MKLLIVPFLLCTISMLLGMYIGIILSQMSDVQGRVIHNLIFGVIGGIILGMVRFEILPDALANSYFFGIVGTILGILFGGKIDHYFEELATHSTRLHGRGIYTAYMFSAAMAFDNIIAGFAIGNGFNITYKEGIIITATLCMDLIVDGVAIAVASCQRHNVPIGTLISLALITNLPLIVGIYLGTRLGGISPNLLALCLGVVGGFMIYLLIDEVIPMSNKIYGGPMINLMGIGAMLGGYFFTYIIF